ncbi:MAG: hypothetical protein NTW72_02720, partial [Gemmatimonadetes bacterium]|nr:hypothetical protein [Gemmatimonadota bacterium]
MADSLVVFPIWSLPMKSCRIAVLLVAVATTVSAQGTKSVYTPGTLTPQQEFARGIYKELVEIQTGVTTGNITTAAVAMAKRFRDAGIPEADIFVGGPRPDKHNVVA